MQRGKSLRACSAAVTLANRSGRDVDCSQKMVQTTSRPQHYLLARPHIGSLSELYIHKLKARRTFNKHTNDWMNEYYLMPTDTGLVRLRVASLPRLACRVADSSTVWRRLFLDISVRLSSMAMMSPAQNPGSCQSCQNKICIPVMLKEERKEEGKFTLLSNHNGSLLRRQPRSMMVLLSKQAHCML